MSTSKDTRFRKATDVNREHATFELLMDGVPILDVGFSDDGRFEISFNEGIVGKVFEPEVFERWIAEGMLPLLPPVRVEVEAWGSRGVDRLSARRSKPR